MAIKSLEIYVDGACSGNPGPGGWGAVLLFGENVKKISGFDKNTTNNIMELTGAVEALKLLKEKCFVNIYTDSKYVKNGITEWIFNWKKNGWKTSNKKDVKNKLLWISLDDMCSRHFIKWHWVKGHADTYYNNVADELARIEIERKHSG